MSLVIEHAAELVRVARYDELCLRGKAMQDLAILRDGAVLIEAGDIQWVGPTSQLPPLPTDCGRID